MKQTYLLVTMTKNLILPISLLIFIACGGSNESSESSLEGYPLEVEDLKEVPVTRSPDSPDAEASFTERKLIKNGSLEFQVSDIAKTVSTIKSELRNLDGYIAKENERKNFDRIDYFIQVRIPTSKFDYFVSAISKGVKDFDEKDIRVKDVTEEYFDLQVRIDNKQKVEARYSEILKKANSIKEILEVEEKLSEVRLEIERLQGKLKLLQNQVKFSTLDVRFYKIIDLPNPSLKVDSFLTELINGFKGGFELIKKIIIGLSYLWPIILLGLGVWFYLKRWSK